MGDFRALLPFALFCVMALAGCITAGPGPQGPADGTLPPVVPSNVTRAAFEGRLLCGAGSPSGTWNPCFASEESRNVFPFAADPGLQTLLVGLRWDATTLLGEKMQVLVESRGFNAISNDEEHRYGEMAGRSDLVVRVDAPALRDTAWSWDNVSLPIEFQVRVFPARTMPPTVIVDQPFEVHVALHHGALAPRDASPFPPDE